MVEGLLAENRLRARIAELQSYRRMGLRTLAEADELELERPQKSKAAQSAADAAAGAAAGAVRAAHAARAPPAARAAAQALGAWRARRGAALDVCGLPGLEHLAARERELCANARVLPAQYLSLKDVMLRDAAAHGFITRAEARSYFRLDPSTSLKIYDLLMAAGWLGDVPPQLLSGNAPGAKQYRAILAAFGRPVPGSDDGGGGGGGGAGGGGGTEDGDGGSAGGGGGEEDGEDADGGGGAAASEEQQQPAPPRARRESKSGLPPTPGSAQRRSARQAAQAHD